jgi:ribulose bisphosphate carboxylase small subunit
MKIPMSGKFCHVMRLDREPTSNGYLGNAKMKWVMTMTMTFEQVAETVRRFSPEQREMLANLMQGWQTESLRHEIAEDARESLAAFHGGQFEPQSARDVIRELRECVKDHE